MATLAIHDRKKNATPKRKAAARYVGRARQIAAGEFKAKCLAIIDEVNKTGREVIITKRGRPVAKVIPFANPVLKEPIIGRLVGIGEIVGDPDDLIKPVFPLDDYDMLK